MTIGAGVTTIDNYAFYYCSYINEIHFNATSMNSLSSGNFVFGSAGQYGYGIDLIIGANVQRIPDNLFYSGTSYAPYLVSVEFEEGSACYTIGNSAFYGCTRLEEVELPSSLVSVSALAFYNCTSLESVVIPAGTQSIGDSAFRYCSALEYVVIPVGVESIGSSAFQYCDALTILSMEASKPSSWSSSWNNSDRPVIWGYTGEEYTYTFVAEGADAIDSITSAVFVTLPVPTRDEYVFAGWYDNEECDGTALGDTYYAGADCTLYAKWVHVSELPADGTSLDRAYTLTASSSGTYVNIATSGQIVYFKFTASVGRTYTFYSSNNGSQDPYLIVYNPDGSQLTYVDDSSGRDFIYTVYLSAGQTAYLGAKLWSSNTGYYYLHVTY